MNDENDSGSELLESLKYTTSERLKSAQRKFTTARNTITGEALNRPYEAFFSEKDKEILRQAASILGQFKNKVEHAKEVRAREEKARDLHLNHCRSQRQKILKEHLPEPASLDEHIETVLFHLALQVFKDSIAPYRGVYFGHGIDWVTEDLDRGVSEKYPQMKVKHMANVCYRESFDWLGENLWAHDTVPDACRVESVLERYRRDWRDKVLTKYGDFFERYRDALSTEFTSEESAERALIARRRRAAFKTIK